MAGQSCLSAPHPSAMQMVEYIEELERNCKEANATAHVRDRSEAEGT